MAGWVRVGFGRAETVERRIHHFHGGDTPRLFDSLGTALGGWGIHGDGGTGMLGRCVNPVVSPRPPSWSRLGRRGLLQPLCNVLGHLLDQGLPPSLHNDLLYVAAALWVTLNVYFPDVPFQVFF